MTYAVKDRVTTPMGEGTVVYCRMAPPTYSEAQVYSVKLDCKAEQDGYTGTIFPAGKVSLLPSDNG